MLKKYLSGTKAFFRLHLDRIRNFNSSADLADVSSEVAREWISELKENGIVVVPDFLDSETCADVREQVDQIIDEHQDACWKDAQNSDNRLFGINFISEFADEFLKNPLFANTACSYMNWKSLVGYTLANRVVFCENNSGSGGGWHRDSARYRDLKVIIYLTDVSTDNGPFQYVRQSHKIAERTRLITKYGAGFAGKRFDGDSAEVIETLDGNFEATGTAGTLIVADTSGIHRGKPLTSGSRYAMTNYYWRDSADVPPRMTEIVPDFITPKLATIVS